jgi:hypothetical protein
MSNQPVYRYPPRSHVYNCPCPRCVQCRSRPLQSGAWIWVAIPVVAGICWIAAAPLRIWHVTGADGKQHPDTATWIAYGIGAALILAAMMAGSIRASRNGTSR